MTRLFLSLLAFTALASAQDTRQVTEPVIPPPCTTLTSTLASPGDEQQLDTVRIQKALDACPPGKAVVLLADRERRAFLSGPLDLRRGVTLVIDNGAILYASRNPRDYDRSPGSCGIVNQSGRGCRALINGDQVPGAAVMGGGAIDGRGGSKLLGQDLTWWDLAEQARKDGRQNCPRLLVLNGCDNFTLYRITLRNSPNFHVSYSGGNGFTVWGIKVYSPKRGARNTDGVDPGNSTNVTITHSYIHAGDDNVAIKAGRGKPTSHMTISHNHFYAGHGMSIGSETDGGASAIRVTDLTIDGADNGIRIKSNASRGGWVHDVVYEDVCIRDTKNPIFMDTTYAGGSSGDRIPKFDDIVLRNVHVAGGERITLDGYDAEHRLGITFDGVVFQDPEKLKVQARHADVTLGPGPVNLVPRGEGVKVLGKPSARKLPDTCEARFVKFPD